MLFFNFVYKEFFIVEKMISTIFEKQMYICIYIF